MLTEGSSTIEPNDDFCNIDQLKHLFHKYYELTGLIGLMTHYY